LAAGVTKVLKRLHYPLDVILLCVRWYVAYSLSLRDLEEMMAERGLAVDHSTVRRWVIKLLPLFEKAFRRHKRPVGRSWRMDETYLKVRGKWTYLYRAVDKAGNTIDFLLRARRNKAAARRYFEKAIGQNGAPDTLTIDKCGANLAALHAVNAERETPIRIRQRKYLNNIIAQDHRAGSPGHQATNRTDAGIQGLPLRAHYCRWHRDHAYDRQGTDEISQGNPLVRRTTILFPGLISRRGPRAAFAQPSLSQQNPNNSPHASPLGIVSLRSSKIRPLSEQMRVRSPNASRTL
jgi:putative transposase